MMYIPINQNVSTGHNACMQCEGKISSPVNLFEASLEYRENKNLTTKPKEGTKKKGA